MGLEMSNITYQKLMNLNVDIDHTADAINEDKVVTARKGRWFKSIPMVSREAQEMVDRIEVETNNRADFAIQRVNAGATDASNSFTTKVSEVEVKKTNASNQIDLKVVDVESKKRIAESEIKVKVAYVETVANTVDASRDAAITDINQKVSQADDAKLGAIDDMTSIVAQVEAAVLINGSSIYNTVAEGLAATQDGEKFSVRSTDPEAFIDEYVNEAGVAQKTDKSYPSSNAKWAVDNILDGNESQKQINDKAIQNVETIDELEQLNVRKNGQKVIVNNRYTYRFNASSTSEIDNISIVQTSSTGRWILQKPENIYASDFCLDSSKSTESQSAILQKANDVAVLLGVTFIVDAEFMMSPIYEDHGVCFKVRSNNSITFTPTGKFKLIPNALDTYSIIHIQDIENYTLTTPWVYGDKSEHLAEDGEWGCGITVYQCKNGYIHKPRVENTWGDGIYIGRQWGLIHDGTPTDVTIFEPLLLTAGRNGFSLCAGTRVRVIRPYIFGVSGKAPEAGIDVEPESANEHLSHLKECVIESPTIEDCNLGLVGYFFPNNSVYEVEVTGILNIKSCAQPVVLCAGGSDNTGYLDINKVNIVNPTANTLIQNAWHKSGSFKCQISELVTDKSLPIVLTLNGDFETQKLGNFTIKRIVNNSAEGKIVYYVPSNVDGCEDHSQYVFERPDRAYLDFDPNFHTLGHDFDSNISEIHKGWTIPSKTMPNIIWLDPSLDTAGTSAIYINSTNDYRRLKVGLHNNTEIVGQGCNISGLKIRKPDGTFFTQAHSQTIGAWIEFQNNPNGNTEIFNQMGTWSFS